MINPKCPEILPPTCQICKQISDVYKSGLEALLSFDVRPCILAFQIDLAAKKATHGSNELLTSLSPEVGLIKAGARETKTHFESYFENEK